MDAENVVQAYMKAEECTFAPLHPMLCGYERVFLKAGESRRIRIPLNPDAFTAVNDEGKRIPAGSRFTLYVGNGQPDARTEELTGEKALCVPVNL